MKDKLFLFGGIGTGVVGICCFTPLLASLLTALSFTGIIIYLDYILLPLLLFFVILTGYGFYRFKQ